MRPRLERRDDPVGDLATSLAAHLRPIRTVGVERVATPALLESTLQADVEDASRAVLRLRKCKHADEVEEIRGSLALCATAYRVARDVVTPGVTELDVFHAMYAEITREAGSTVEFRGDFASGERASSGSIRIDDTSSTSTTRKLTT